MGRVRLNAASCGRGRGPVAPAIRAKASSLAIRRIEAPQPRFGPVPTRLVEPPARLLDADQRRVSHERLAIGRQARPFKDGYPARKAHRLFARRRSTRNAPRAGKAGPIQPNNDKKEAWR